jgi:hypothetical protein
VEREFDVRGEDDLSRQTDYRLATRSTQGRQVRRIPQHRFEPADAFAAPLSSRRCWRWPERAVGQVGTEFSQVARGQWQSRSL